MMFGVIEGTGFESVSNSFDDCLIGHARVERLWTGARWCEGPAWFAAGRYLMWSDIPNNRMMRWDETDGSVSEFRNPSNNSNGNTVDLQGRLVTCEHLSRCVTRTEHNGSITVLADQFDGKRLNSPNDVVVKSDGSVWFSDPSYGIMMDYEGERASSEIGASHVYRIDPGSSAVTCVASDYVQPNGLAFSPDEQFLYVSDTGGSHEKNGPAHIRKHSVNNDSVSDGVVISNCDNGFYDGFRLDRDGRIWTSAADGVHCLSAEGELLGKILIPEFVSNVCFGGPKLNRLFICGTTSLYSAFLNVNGTN